MICFQGYTSLKEIELQEIEYFFFTLPGIILELHPLPTSSHLLLFSSLEGSGIGPKWFLLKDSLSITTLWCPQDWVLLFQMWAPWQACMVTWFLVYLLLREQMCLEYSPVCSLCCRSYSTRMSFSNGRKNCKTCLSFKMDSKSQWFYVKFDECWQMYIVLCPLQWSAEDKAFTSPQKFPCAPLHSVFPVIHGPRQALISCHYAFTFLWI